MTDQSDLFVAYHRCTFCREQTITIRVECTPPDDATEIFRWFCSTGCVAKYETNQIRPGEKCPSCGKDRKKMEYGGSCAMGGCPCGADL